MTFRTITREVDVEIDLCDFKDSELIDELQCRGVNIDRIADGLRDSRETVVGFDLPREILLLNSKDDLKDLFIELLEENYDPSNWSRKVTMQKLDSILS